MLLTQPLSFLEEYKPRARGVVYFSTMFRFPRRGRECVTLRAVISDPRPLPLSCNSFCLSFEWEDVVYNTGNGTDCPAVDAGATILKVRLNPFTPVDVAIKLIVYCILRLISKPAFVRNVA